MLPHCISKTTFRIHQICYTGASLLGRYTCAHHINNQWTLLHSYYYVWGIFPMHYEKAWMAFWFWVFIFFSQISISAKLCQLELLISNFIKTEVLCVCFTALENNDQCQWLPTIVKYKTWKTKEEVNWKIKENTYIKLPCL